MLSSACARSLGSLHANDRSGVPDTRIYSSGRPPCDRQRCKVAFAREYSSEPSYKDQAHSAAEQQAAKAQERAVPNSKRSSSRRSPAKAPSSSSTKSSDTRPWRSGVGSGHKWPWSLWSAGDASSSSSSSSSGSSPAYVHAASKQHDSSASYSLFSRLPAAVQQRTGRGQLQSNAYQAGTALKQGDVTVCTGSASSAAAVVTHTAVISSSSYLRHGFTVSSSTYAAGGSSTSTSSSWEESAAALRCVEDTLDDSTNMITAGLDSSQLFLYDLMPPAAADAVSADTSGSSSSSSKLALLLGDTYPLSSAELDGSLASSNLTTSASPQIGPAAAAAAAGAAAGASASAAEAAAAAAAAPPTDPAAFQRQLLSEGRHWASSQQLQQPAEKHGWSLSLDTTTSSHTVPVPNAASLQRTLKAAGPLSQPSSSSASPSSSSDDADWLTAVLSAPTSRLSSHSNAVLTNSLKRLASLRSSGGALAGSSAAAVVNAEGLLDSIRARFGSFQLQQFEEVALQLAQLGYLPDEAWLAAFERSSMGAMLGGSPRLLSRLLLSRSKLGGQVSSDWCAACCQHMAAAPDRLSVSSWVNALCALVRLKHTPNRHFQTTFLSATAERLDDVSPELLTHLVWSLSRLKLSPSYIWWRSLVRATASIEKPFSHGQLASLVHSVALWVEPCDIAAQDAQRFVDMLLVEIHDQLGLLQPAELTTVVWSLGSLVAARKLQPDHALYDDLLEAIQGQLPRLNPVQCSNLCWGLAKLNHKFSKGFADALLLEVQAQLSGLSSSNLCSVMWALAKLKLVPPPPFRQQLWEELHSRVKGLELDSLSTLSWSLAQLQLQPPSDILADLCEHSRPLLAGCDAAHLTNIVWALGRLGARPGCEWLQAAEDASMQVLPSAGLKQVVNLAWGLCRLCSQPGAQFESIEASQRPSTASPGDRVMDLRARHTPSAAWQAACLRELRLRCICEGVDTDCKQLVQMLRELGVDGFADAAAAVADQLFAEQDEFESCFLQFQPGCQ